MTTYAASTRTKAGIRIETIVTCLVASKAHEYRTTAAGVHYDSGMIPSQGSQAWANKHTKDAKTYLDSLTREEAEALTPDVLIHPTLRNAILASFAAA